ncbi:MAG: PDZ domain-containing protein [Gemmatimonadaceae bacterium]
MKRRLSASGAAGALLLLTPFALGAQATIRATPRTSNTAGGNMCAQLSSGPSRLAASPEGEALMRMKAELEMVQRALRLDTVQQKQVIIVQGRLDSVGRMITGSNEPGSNRIYFETRPGSLTRLDGQQFDLSDPMNQMMVSAKLRELQPQVAELMRGSAGTIVGTLNITLPTLGFIGISATAGTFPTSIDPMQPFAYCDYPRVESVEAGSPADRAGLMAGDTLIEYNNRDLRQTNVNYPDLLVPGKQLAIRYRRDGKVHLAVMRVAARDSEYTRLLTSMGACTEAEAANGCRSEQVIIRRNLGGSAGGAVHGTRTPGTTAAAGVYSPATPNASIAVGTRRPLLELDGSGGLRFAGALMRAIDEQTALSMGNESGLLVVSLPSSSPSYFAGLRYGDWVISANGVGVHDINSFIKAFESKAAERVMMLQVSSKSAGARTITIRW